MHHVHCVEVVLTPNPCLEIKSRHEKKQKKAERGSPLQTKKSQPPLYPAPEQILEGPYYRSDSIVVATFRNV